MWLFIIIYALSPIPLLVLFIVSRVQLSKARREAKASEIRQIQADIQNAREKENYRRYVNQLQNQVKALDPDAKIGYLDPSSSPAAGKPIPSPSRPPVPASQPAQTSQPALTSQPAPVPQPAPVSQPAFVPQQTPPQVQTSSAAQQVRSLPQPSGTAPVPPAASSDNAQTPVILTVGVILLLLASIGFISATWSMLGAGVRAIALLSFSAIFLGAGIIARARLKLPNTSLAFYSIGSAALPITIFGASAFGLMGEYFALHIPEIYNTLLLSFGCLLVLLGFGAVFFRSRVFAVGSLICTSIEVFTLAVMFKYPYSQDLLLVVLFASAVILLAPFISRIREDSLFAPYAKVITVFAIINLYVMTIVALCLSHINIWSGVFLLAMAAVFFFASVLKRETNLLSLPAIVLLLVGTAQIVGMSGLLQVSIWMLTAGISFAALSFVPYFRELFSKVLHAFGLIFLITATMPIFYYSLTVDSLAYIPLTIVPCFALIWLSLRHDQPLIFSGAILPCFNLLWITSVRLFSLDTPYIPNALGDYLRIGNSEYMLSKAAVTLLGLIIAAVLYGLFTFIPHHRFYTSTGNILLFSILVIFFENFISTIEDPYAMWFFLLTVVISGLCIFMGCRTDKLNYRDPTLSEPPKTISMNRCFYASVWPLFLFLFFAIKLGREQDSTKVTIVALLLFAVITYLFLVIRLIRAGSGRRALADASISTPAALTANWAALLTTAFLDFCLLMNGLLSADTEPFLFVMQHLAPLMIPLLFLLLLLLEKDSVADISSSSKSTFSLTPFFYTLFGLLSLTAVLPFALRIPTAFGVDSFYLGMTFVFTVLALLALSYLAITHLLSGKERDTVPAKLLSSRNQALFLWACGIGTVLFFGYVIRIIDDGYPVFPILLSLILISVMVLFSRYRSTIGSIAATMETVVFITCIDHYTHKTWDIPVWCRILLFLLPVLIYCVISLVRKTGKLRHDAFFKGALFSQFLLFIIVPFITMSDTDALADSAISVREIAHTSQICDHLFRGLLSVFYTSRYVFLVMPGFFLIEVLMILKSRDKVSRRRSVAILILTFSTLVWMRMMILPSLSNFFEPSYLIPSTLLIVFLPWLFTEMKKEDIYSVRLTLSSIEMGILAALTLCSNDTVCLFFFGIVSFIVLLGGYFLKKKGFLVLGTVCVLGMLAYITNRVWGDMSWWIYLFVTGTILITIAVRNEIKKRK